MDVYGCKFRAFVFLVFVLFSTSLAAQDSSGSAFGESVDITVQASVGGIVSEVVAVESGPLPQVMGTTPPNFVESDSVASVDVDASLGGLIIPSVVDVLQTGLMEVDTSGDESPQADSNASVVDLDLTLLADQLAILDLLLIGITGTNNTVVSAATAGGSCDTGLTASGDAVLTNLEFSGLVADTLGIAGAIQSDPAPNTLLVDAVLNVPGVITGSVTITLNEQIPSGDGITSAGMTVNAIHVSVQDLTILGLLGVAEATLNGDVIISQSVAGVSCPQADLEITKIDDPDPVFVQDPLGYTVTVVNDGPDDAPNVQVVDTLPPSVNYVDAVPSQGSCSESALTVTCDLGLLPARPPGAAGSAFGEFLALSIDSSLVPAAVDVDSGPTPSVSGSAPPPFNEADSVLAVNESTDIQLLLPPLLPTTLDVLSTGEINVATIGDDGTPAADSSASVDTLGLTILEAVPLVLDLFLDISADTVATTATAGGTCGALTADGSTTLTSATLDSDIAGLVTIVGDLDVSPSPNTVLFDGPVLGGQLTIILNEQIVTGDGATSAGITVNAIHITLSGVEIPILDPTGHLVRINGEVIIAQSVAEVDCSTDGIATIDISVIPKMAGVIFNDAAVDSDSQDPVPEDNMVQEPTTVLDVADLAITKDNGTDMVVAGSQTTYAIVATNNGPSDVTGALVDDTFPPELSCTWTCSPSGGASCTAGPVAGDISDNVDIPAGDSVTYTAVCNIDPGASGSLVNIAMVTPPQDVTDPDLNNNSDTDTDVIQQLADLALTKDNGSTTVVAGEMTTYSIVVSNIGPNDVTGATVDDTFPPELSCTWTCAPAGGASCTAGPIAGNISDTVDIPAGDSVTYTAVCDIDPGASGSLTNTATVIPPDDISDPDPDNNSDSDTDTVLREADLSVSKDNGTTTVVAGEMTTYTIVVGNNGPSSVDDAMVSDVFPAELTCSYTSVAAGGASGNTAAGAGDIADTLVMPVGSSVTYTVTCDIDPAASGTLVNTVTVMSNNTPDPDTGNNTATDTDTIERLADLSIIKADDIDPITAGETLTYTLTVDNAGPSDASNVVVTDNLPAGVNFVSAGASQGSCSEVSLVVTCNLGNIAAGAGATVTIQIVPLQGGDILNTASVVGDETDPEPEDNMDDETTTVTPSADLAIVKVGTPNPVMVGELLTYTLTVTNNGPSDATGVIVTDTLPDSVTFVSVDSSQGSCGEVMLVVTCDLGTILTGASATITIEVIPNETGTITNEAHVESQVGDPNPEDNDDDTDTDVEIDNRTTLLVTKDFDDDNPAGVTVQLECNTGLPLQQSGVVHDPDAAGLMPGDFTVIEFVVGDFATATMDCDITEVIPDGYLPAYTAGATTGLAGTISSDEDGCHYELIEGGQFTCDILNTLQPVEVVVEKEWIDEHPEYLLPTLVEVTLFCDAPIDPGFACLGTEGNGGAPYCGQQYIGPNNPGVWEVLPHFEGTTCSATEELITGVLTDDSDCEAMLLLPGQGGGCLIVNTRLFAGIPTLNQYGLILLVLSMLGIGALAYRRFA